jgi:hypothetical protein
VGRVREVCRLRRRVGVGAPDPSLTPVSGMVAVTELIERLDVIRLLDAAIGPIKARGRGFTGGQLLVGVAAAQLAGRTSSSAWTASSPIFPGRCSHRWRG